jgi:DNA (cytosine-5)-methyltransferase 1
VKFLSVCSGIEAASVAWGPLGWQAVAVSEIDAFPSAVLAHRYPDVPNWGDMTRYQEWPDANVDVFVGGTPCQSFSVAGLRKGLADPRGNLTLTYLAIAERYCPRWLVWENVPGVLSSGGGRDFGAFLGGLVELGYGWAYRVLDAQFFGVAQRRRRVFVVASARGWAAAAAVLFELSCLRGDSAPRREAGEGASERAARSLAIRGRDGIASAELGDDKANAILTPSGGRAGIGVGAILEGPAYALRGDSAPRREAGVGIAPTLAARTRGGGGLGTDTELDGGLIVEPIPFDETQITSPANRLTATPGAPSHTLARGARPPSIAFNSRQNPVHNEELSGALDTNSTQAVTQGVTVRRLTPRECERLQGFPDDWTAIPWRKGSGPGPSFESLLELRGKQLREPTTCYCPDSPRYKAIGNSMAVPVIRWIGERITAVEDMLREINRTAPESGEGGAP